MFMRILRKRLGEQSTYIGLLALLTLAGVHMDPTQADLFIQAGIALGGFLMAFFPDQTRARKAEDISDAADFAPDRVRRDLSEARRSQMRANGEGHRSGSDTGGTGGDLGDAFGSFSPD